MHSVRHGKCLLVLLYFNSTNANVHRRLRLYRSSDKRSTVLFNSKLPLSPRLSLSTEYHTWEASLLRLRSTEHKIFRVLSDWADTVCKSRQWRAEDMPHDTVSLSNHSAVHLYLQFREVRLLLLCSNRYRYQKTSVPIIDERHVWMSNRKSCINESRRPTTGMLTWQLSTIFQLSTVYS